MYKITKVNRATEEYINSELRKYYYDMKEHEHSFHDFDRWKIYGRKR